MSFFGALGLLGLAQTCTVQTTESTEESSFRVVLECPKAEPFGITLAGNPQVQGLLVVDVIETAAVRKWNDKNPERPIEVGQAVLEVNGISEPRAAMFHALPDTQTAELVLSWELDAKQRELLKPWVKLHQRRAIVEGILQDVPVVAEEPCSCSICLEEGGEETQLFCGHRFHKVCLRKWLVSALRCPLCNSQKMRL
eukprot:Skav205860  [mRNA]  locus=scaffold766:128131:128721:+ [translate_table: standard]